MIQAAEWGLAALFCVWLLFSAGCQLRGGWFERRLKTKDRFSLLPRYTFFAPSPANSDYHLLYRREHRDGTISPWQEIVLQSSRPWITALWNPKRRATKAVRDMIRSLGRMRLRLDGRLEALRFTRPYVGLARYVSRIEHPEGAVATQFLILKTFGPLSEEPVKPVLRSDFHPLTSRRRPRT